MTSDKDNKTCLRVAKSFQDIKYNAISVAFQAMFPCKTNIGCCQELALTIIPSAPPLSMISIFHSSPLVSAFT